jgi:anti-sigma factor RsiW
MSAHIDDLLNAYLDDELSSQEKRRADAHLSACPQCQVRLAQLRELSQMLRKTARLAPQSSPQAFLTDLETRLPERKSSAVQRFFEVAWALFPGGLALSWGLVQALFITVFALNLALLAGWLPEISALLPGSNESLLSALLNAPAFSQPGDLRDFVVQLFTTDDALLHGFVLYILLNAGIAVMFAAWMAGWLMSKRSIQLRTEER